MKIIVGVKRVVDYKTTVRIKSDGSDVETSTVKMSMNPFDEIAVEEAIRLKEKGIASEVIVVSIGKSTHQETLRHALAMGCDRAILMTTELSIQPLACAKIFQHLAQTESPSLIILGKQAIDTDDNQVGQMLAGLLHWPQGTFASNLAFHDNGVSVTREIDGGLETLFLNLPAVITTDLRLNEPRYLSLPNIVKAKAKPLNLIAADTLGLDLQPHIELLSVSAPSKKRNGVKLNSVQELITRLKDEAQVI
ncbi:MAG: electron transfer flavoprotein subunit beta/FixA family protein [Gammaproteobacteria bacterium]|nr:electron transfer flavoprotein subunit beta/FixA family protein [Gammaproteobacteria bacterium]